MESAPVRLIVTHGPNLGHEYILRGDEASIGRSDSNSIVLPSPEISRRHARLWQEGESTFLEDLGSTNGTYVNNRRLHDPVALFDGDEVQIGDSFRLLFTSPGGVTRPISLVPEVEDGEPQSALKSSEPSGIPTSLPASEIPTPTPPLSTSTDEQEFMAEQAVGVGGQRHFILYCGCAALSFIAVCFLLAIFLDSYQQGRLLYCGSLNRYFQFLLGPVGFNPICP